VDFYWYYPHPSRCHHHEGDLEVATDDYGRCFCHEPVSFAPGGQGFKPLADYIHSKGLKFGIHIMRGIPRQAVKRNLPVLGTSAHAQDIANPKDRAPGRPRCTASIQQTGGPSLLRFDCQLYAQWGVDYIKADDMSWPPSRLRPIRTMRLKSKR